MLSKSYSNLILECGTDEAGRGCLAGPVFAAAVILPLDFTHDILNDSKQLTEKEQQLENIEERYVTGSLTSELYEKYAKKFKTEIDQISAQLSNSVIDSSNLKTGVEKALEIAGRCCMVKTELGQNPNVSLKNSASCFVSKSCSADNGFTNGILFAFLFLSK